MTIITRTHTFILIILLAISTPSRQESPASDAAQLLTYIINECRESPSDFAEFFKENVLSVMEAYDKQVDKFQKDQILRASEDLLLYLQYSDSKFRLQYNENLSRLAFRHSLKMKIRGRTGHWFEKVSKGDLGFQSKDPQGVDDSAQSSSEVNTELLIFDSNDTLSQLVQKSGQVRGLVGQAVFRFPRSIDSLVYSGSLALLDWMFVSRPNRKMLLHPKMKHIGAGIVEDSNFNYVTFLLVEEYRENKERVEKLEDQENQIVEALERDRLRFTELFKESEEEVQKSKHSEPEESESESEDLTEDSGFGPEGKTESSESQPSKKDDESDKSQEAKNSQTTEKNEKSDSSDLSELEESENTKSDSTQKEEEKSIASVKESEEISQKTAEVSEKENSSTTEESDSLSDDDEDELNEPEAESLSPEKSESNEEEESEESATSKLKQTAVVNSSTLMHTKLQKFFKKVDQFAKTRIHEKSN